MSAGPVYRFRDCTLRPATRELLRGGEPVALPSKVFDCLLYLIEHRERAVGRDELGAAVWGRVDVTDAQLSQAVLRARRAIGDAGSDQGCIRTMPKFGYVWNCEVEQGEEPAAVVALPDAPRDTPAEFRPQRHEEELTPLPVPEAHARSPRTRRAAIAVLALLLLGASIAALWGWRARPPAPPATAGSVLILPLEVSGGAGTSWVRLGAIDILADRMRLAGLPVAPSDTTLALLRADAAGPDSATLRERADAAWIVQGEAARIEGGWRIELTARGAGGLSYSQQAQAAQVIEALTRGADGLLLQLGHAPPALDAQASGADQSVREIKAALLENDLEAARRVADESAALVADPFEQAFQRAQIDFRAGRMQEAVAAIGTALAQLDAEARPGLAGRMQILLGQVDLMMDQPAAAAPRFEEAVRRLDAERHPLDRARAMAGRGAAHFGLGEHARGLEDIRRARMLLQQSGDPLAQARIDQMAGSAELLRRRPAQARVLLTSAAERLRDFGAWNERMHALSELVIANLDLLDLEAAQQASDAAMSLMAQVPNPLHRAEALLNRALLRMQQGRMIDARQLIEGYDALGLPDHPRMRGLKHGLLTYLARWEHDDAETLKQAELALAALPENERYVAGYVVWARAHAYWRTRGAQHDGGLDALPAILAKPPEPVMVALARVERIRRRGGDPDPGFAALLEQTEREGAPFDQLVIVEAWVHDLLARGQVEQVAPLLGRLAPVAGRNYRYALLELRLSHAEKNPEAWRRALQRASALAGERPIPPELRLEPTPD